MWIKTAIRKSSAETRSGSEAQRFLGRTVEWRQGSGNRRGRNFDGRSNTLGITLPDWQRIATVLFAAFGEQYRNFAWITRGGLIVLKVLPLFLPRECMNDKLRPIAVYHEHPDWFRPLFAELDRRASIRCSSIA
jgi:hypothetical protein